MVAGSLYDTLKLAAIRGEESGKGFPNCLSFQTTVAKCSARGSGTP